MRRGIQVTALVCALTGTTSEAVAGDFSSSGDFSFSSQALHTCSFEELPEPVAGLTLKESDSALEGARTATLKSTQQFVFVPLDLTDGPSGNHVARLWVRHGTPTSYVVIKYSEEARSTIIATGPTGRVTSDGWVELSTNPFPFDATRTSIALLALLGTAEVDALEVVPHGALVADTSCAADASSCQGADHVCIAGTCRDMNEMVPPPPADADRAAAVAYLRSRLEHFFGGVESRAKYLPAALAQADTLTEASTGWSFWNGWMTAIHRLHDWHTQTSGPPSQVLGVPRKLQACFVDGKADASQTAAPSTPGLPDIMVSHVGPSSTLGLRPGDRLVAIDGQHPVSWVASLIDRDWGYRRGTDEASNGDAAERLYDLLPRFAHQLTVVRCDKATSACATKTEQLDLSTLPEDDGKVTLACDLRPAYHTADAHAATDPYGAPVDQSHVIYTSVFGGEIDESQPGERIHAMTWNYLYGPSVGPVGQQMADRMSELREGWSQARGVILDHRLGEGGTTDTFASFTPGFLKKQTVCVSPPYIQVAGVGGPATTTDGLAFFEHFSASPTSKLEVGDDGADMELPVALLLHRDVSASDFLAQAMKASGGKVRLFGPYPTSGSFSTLFQYSYWSDLSWLVGSGDSVLAGGSTLIGHGVAPDEVVVPLQSDLVAGQDTVFNAALAWVRKELK